MHARFLAVFQYGVEVNFEHTKGDAEGKFECILEDADLHMRRQR